MIYSTTETIPGKEIEEIVGIVTGNVVQAKHIGRDIMAGLKTIVGGELRGYTEMLTEARDIAVQRLDAAASIEGQTRWLVFVSPPVQLWKASVI